MRMMLKSKIHRAKVTEANLEYQGSITIDEDLLEAADILPYEQVQVLDINNGSRLETYALPGQRGSGRICINGAAARLVSKGDMVIILTYSAVNEAEAHSLKPRLVYVDVQNRMLNHEAEAAWA
ncbi:MAG: aspartate 1-decarboxylase [Chloroflexi bacterium]|nr:aspartate 1-decarboxylase [Chloroflexota bacterium]